MLSLVKTLCTKKPFHQYYNEDDLGIQKEARAEHARGNHSPRPIGTPYYVFTPDCPVAVCFIFENSTSEGK